MIEVPVGVGADTFEGMLLRSVIGRIIELREKVMAEAGPNLDDQLLLINAAELFAEIADQAFLNQAGPNALVAVSTATRLLDLVTDFTPGASLIKDAAIIVTGRNPITGEMVSDAERAMVAAGLLVPSFFSGGAKALVKTARHLEAVAGAGKAVSPVADDLVATLRRSDEALADQLLPCPAATLATPPPSLRRDGAQSGSSTMEGSLAGLEPAPPQVLAACNRVLGEVTAEIAERARANLQNLKRGDVGFGSATTQDYAATYRKHYAQYDSEIGQVHHAVEKQVLTKEGYENLLTPEQVHSLENLRGIPRGQPGWDIHQGEIRKIWNDFYTQFEMLGRPPSVPELLRQAKMIDDSYGHLFIPPIR